MRLVSGGSKRTRHLYIRSGYLAIMVIALLLMLLRVPSGNLQVLASAGANAFQFVAYVQLAMICLLAPVFMAGAIAQEANPKTWDILLTTPLNSLQVVLGNLFGRLFFILALLASSLPLFAITQYFGGVPGRSIFLTYLISGISALVVGAIAIALSASRQAGRRTVFVFYIAVVIYLVATWALDWGLRPIRLDQVTWMTPLNPFLSQRVLLNPANYHPPTAVDLLTMGRFERFWLGSPIAAFCWVGSIISIILIAWSSVFLRLIGQNIGRVPWYRRLLKQGAADTKSRPSRKVWHNPIAWREASAKQNTFTKQLAKWGFVAVGLLLAMIFIVLYQFGTIKLDQLRAAFMTLLAMEIGIIGLTALNISATAISQEREDGTLDQLLTTPLTPSYYVSGKLRGIVSFLVPMMALPIATLALASLYVVFDGFAVEGGVQITASVDTQKIQIPFILPEGMLTMALVLVPFTAFCVMVGLHWSLKSKGTISSVITAVGIVIAVVGVISLCGYQGGNHMSLVGALLAEISPLTAVWSTVYPEMVVESSLSEYGHSTRVILLIGSAAAAVIYSFIVYGMHKSMLGPNGRNFDMTIRRLSGTN